MYSFKNDYSEGAHPEILNAIVTTNFEQCDGYGKDAYSLKAAEILKQKIKCDNIDIHFLVGGTQTNLTSISAFLRPHEAAISANTGHINTHETGAIEATGHKVISVDVYDGKLTTSHVQSVLDSHTDEHMVKPKLVYISNPTEIGTIYKKDELESLNDFCRKNKLLLFVDGARLGSALTSVENDLDLSDLGRLTDAFYIGGTKNGALFGEALVICNDLLKDDFRFHIKQKGALLAKGRLLGIQFLELFKNDLFFYLANHANDMAYRLDDGIRSLDYKFLIDSPTNQLFPIFPNEIINELSKKYSFMVWSKIDEDHSAIRLVTSWATRQDAVSAFIEDLQSLTTHKKQTLTI
jgi:threonine aldolase